MSSFRQPNPFNSPLETGVRSLAILVEAYPKAFDMQRLVEMDYLVVHSGDAGGPKSLHAPLPLRAGELLVRRALIEKGLSLMMSRHLVSRLTNTNGFSFRAGEVAAPFIASLETEYSCRLLERARWVVERFEGVATNEISILTHSFFKRWNSEFQSAQRLGDML